MKNFVRKSRDYILAAATDRGKAKERNEDYFGIFEPETEELFRNRGILLVVADGMGGLLRGGRASRTMVDTVGDSYFTVEGRDTIEHLYSAFMEGNRRVFEQVGGGIEVKAGTTCTSAALFDESINIAHVGDSRAYLINIDSARVLTKDHSYVATLRSSVGLDEGKSNSSLRRVMTRSVGVRKKVDIDLLRDIPCKRGDTLLLCSDGLFSMISEEEIVSAVRLCEAEKVCSQLIKLALKAGGKDNITAVIAKKL